jgi:hypothetical protein
MEQDVLIQVFPKDIEYSSDFKYYQVSISMVGKTWEYVGKCFFFFFSYFLLL